MFERRIRTMKKLIAIILVLSTLCLSLVACAEPTIPPIIDDDETSDVTGDVTSDNPLDGTTSGDDAVTTEPSDGTTTGGNEGTTDPSSVTTTDASAGTTAPSGEAAGKYTVKFKSSYGSVGSMVDKTYTYGETVNLPVNAFTKEGYVFRGWRDNKGNKYADAAEFVKQASDGEVVTLTAQWSNAHGYDISEYQSGYDMDSIFKTDRPGYVILRAGLTGYGGDGTTKDLDDYFETFYNTAKANNIPVGAYWYSCANTYNEGKAEAQYMYENCLKGKTFEYPIYIDIENTQHQQGYYDSTVYAGVTDAIDGFCDYMLSKGLYPAVYTYASFCVNFDIAEVEAKYDVWVACYAIDIVPYGIDALNEYYQRKGGGTATMWQYAGDPPYTSSASGFSGDANWVYKDYETFIKRFGFNGFSATGTGKFKDNLTLGQEVLDGKWGIGAARKAALIAAGYDPVAVQEAVNYLL